MAPPLLVPAAMIRRPTMLRALTLVALSVGAAACSESHNDIAYVVSSQGLATSALEGTFMISGDAGKLTASAGFRDGRSGDLVSLEGVDAVYCDAVRLEERGTWLGVVVPRKAPGELYRFELRRATESVFVDVPAIDEVKVLAPASGAELPQTSPVTVAWEPRPGTEIEAQLFANCAITNVRAATESGSLTLPAFTPVGVPGGPQNASDPPCAGTVSVTRTRKSDVATALARSSAIAEERARVTIRVVK